MRFWKVGFLLVLSMSFIHQSLNAAYGEETDEFVEKYEESSLSEEQFNRKSPDYVKSDEVALYNQIFSQIVPYGSYSRFLPLVRERQLTDYWCGPAAVKAILGSFGYRDTQAMLANEMATNYNGTYVYRMTSALNTNTWLNYKHSTVYEMNFDSTYSSSITRGFPVVLSINTSVIEEYNGKGWLHYVVGYGSHITWDNRGSGRSLLYYFDPYYPWNNWPDYYTDFNTMQLALKNNSGYFIWGQ